MSRPSNLSAATLVLVSATLAACAGGPLGGDNAGTRASPNPGAAPAVAVAAAWQAPRPVVAKPAVAGATGGAGVDAGVGAGAGAGTSAGASASASAGASAAPTANLVEPWARFADPALPPLVEAARTASASVSAAGARIARARAASVAAGAAALPQATVVGSAAQARSLPSPANAATATSLSLGAQAAWELDLFGAVAAGQRAAQARLGGASAALQDAHLAVAAEVASTYTNLRGCEAQRVTSQQDADSRAETARLTTLSADAGFTAPADAALARAGAAQARNQAAQQRAACATLIKALVELTDLPEPELRARLASATARLPQPAALGLPAVPAALLARRPDLVDAERAVLAAAGDAEQAAARERPQLSLSGSVGGLSLRSRGETTSGGTWSIGPLSVNFPLFDGGSRRANTVAARAVYDDAVAQYRAQVRRAVREVESGLVSWASAEERFDDAVLASADFLVSLRATEARQKGGLATLFDLEAARRNAVAAQSALIELQRERALAWVGLYRALGGDFGATGVGQVVAKPVPLASR